MSGFRADRGAVRLFRHRDRPGDSWVTGRGRGAVCAAAPLLFLQTPGAQASLFWSPRPPCHPWVASVAFCAKTGGKSLGKSQPPPPPPSATSGPMLWKSRVATSLLACGTQRLSPKQG